MLEQNNQRKKLSKRKASEQNVQRQKTQIENLSKQNVQRSSCPNRKFLRAKKTKTKIYYTQTKCFRTKWLNKNIPKENVPEQKSYRQI